MIPPFDGHQSVDDTCRVLWYLPWRIAKKYAYICLLNGASNMRDDQNIHPKMGSPKKWISKSIARDWWSFPMGTANLIQLLTLAHDASHWSTRFQLLQPETRLLQLLREGKLVRQHDSTWEWRFSKSSSELLMFCSFEICVKILDVCGKPPQNLR